MMDIDKHSCRGEIDLGKNEDMIREIKILNTLKQILVQCMVRIA